MNAVVQNGSKYLRLGKVIGGIQTQLADSIKGHHYLNVYRHNGDILRLALSTLFTDSKFTTKVSGQLKILTGAIGWVVAETCAGLYCEYGNQKRLINRVSRTLAKKMHLVSLSVALVAIARLAVMGLWLNVAVLGFSYTLKLLCAKQIIPIPMGKIDNGLNLIASATHLLSGPALFDINTFISVFEISSLVCSKLIKKARPKHDSEVDFASLTPGEFLKQKDRVKSFGFYTWWSDLYFTFSPKKSHIRPFYPKLEKENGDIEELKNLFNSIDWSKQKPVVIAKLNDDRKFVENHWDLSSSDAVDFYKSPYWRDLKRGFDRFVDDIAHQKSFKDHPDVQKKMEYYCRFLIQKIGKLIETDPIAACDHLLELAVTAGEYCPMGQMTAVSQIFNSLVSKQSQLSSGIAQRLHEVRLKNFDKFYQQLASIYPSIQKSNQELCNQLKSRKVKNLFGKLKKSAYCAYLQCAMKMQFAASKLVSFDSVHTYHMVRAMLPQNHWGLIDVGSKIEFEAAKSPIERFYIQSNILPISTLYSSRLYSSDRIIHTIAEDFKNRRLSIQQLFEWMANKIEEVRDHLKPGEYEKLIDRLASYGGDGAFFGIPTPIGNDSTVDKKIISLLALDLGIIEPILSNEESNKVKGLKRVKMKIGHFASQMFGI